MKPVTKTDAFADVKLMAGTPQPQLLSWLAAHQDYSSEPVYDYESKLRNKAIDELGEDNVLPHAPEPLFGRRLIKATLSGGKGHFGVLEHPSMTVNGIYQPHLVVAQVTRHRLASFDVQSFRYTGQQLLTIATQEDLERYFYFRPIGTYKGRDGKQYEITEELRQSRKDSAMQALQRYKLDMAHGCSEEDARNSLPYCLRQHFVMTMNLRAWLHFFDIRDKPNTQLETQWFAQDCFNCFEQLVPELALWYNDNRRHKALLAP